MGFKQTASDPCLYVHTNLEGEIFVVAVYVDNIILGGKSESKLNQVKRELSQKFEMKDLGPLHHFLGVKVIQDQLNESIWVGQPTYTERILHRFDIHNSNPVSSPVNPDVKLNACENPDDVCNQEMYQAVVGSLNQNQTRYCICCKQRCSFLCKSHKRTLDCSEENPALPKWLATAWIAVQS